MYVIDRTKNPHGKSIPNTQRFLDRAKAQIRKSVAYHIQKETLSDSTEGTNNRILITGSGINEPSFWIDYSASEWIKVFPGNPKTDDVVYFTSNFTGKPTTALTQFNVGDEIYKPEGSGSGGGSDASPDLDGEDDFVFSLNNEDWTAFLFDQLNLPNQKLVKSVIKSMEFRKAGFTTQGSPANLNLLRTMRNAQGRRIGMHRPRPQALLDLQALLDSTDEQETKDRLQLEIDALKQRMRAVPWIDPMDVRYATHVKEPQLKFNAVMFCLMDVSGSMTQHMKKLAKYFYVFLYKFLKSKYEKVDLVFIRHHSVAAEVDEKTFFYSPETGGTIVSTALEEMKRVVQERYDPSVWNIYCAQVSDGDNWTGDNPKVIQLLEQVILPITRYYTYIEVAKEWDWDFGSKRESDLWGIYKKLASAHENFVTDKIKDVKDLWPIMVRLFGDTVER